jgi:hypothetical protein
VLRPTDSPVGLQLRHYTSRVHSAETRPSRWLRLDQDRRIVYYLAASVSNLEGHRLAAAGELR